MSWRLCSSKGQRWVLGSDHTIRGLDSELCWQGYDFTGRWRMTPACASPFSQWLNLCAGSAQRHGIMYAHSSSTTEQVMASLAAETMFGFPFVIVSTSSSSSGRWYPPLASIFPPDGRRDKAAHWLKTQHNMSAICDRGRNLEFGVQLMSEGASSVAGGHLLSVPCLETCSQLGRITGQQPPEDPPAGQDWCLPSSGALRRIVSRGSCCGFREPVWMRPLGKRALCCPQHARLRDVVLVASGVRCWQPATRPKRLKPGPSRKAGAD